MTTTAYSSFVYKVGVRGERRRYVACGSQRTSHVTPRWPPQCHHRMALANYYWQAEACASTFRQHILSHEKTTDSSMLYP